MNPCCRHRSAAARARTSGSTLLTALLTVAVLSFVAANVLLSVSARYSSAYRSAGWNEALFTAEAGVDVVASAIAHVVPGVIPGVNGLGSGYSQDSQGNLVGGMQINSNGVVTNGTILNIPALQLTHGGEGSTTQQAVVSLDVVPLSTLLGGGTVVGTSAVSSAVGGDLYLLRLRSTGTVLLGGTYTAGMSRQDNELWRLSLFNDSNTQAAVSQPQVSRQIEIYLRPVFAFDSAVASGDSLLAANANTVFDSFNSKLPLYSTNGQYDSTKRESDATLRANGTAVTLGGKVYGDVYTNGGNVAKDSHVTGKVNNASYCPLPVVTAPAWTTSAQSLGAVATPTTVVAGTAVLPTQYRFDGVTSLLHITSGLAALGGSVEIFINGDVTGGIEIDPGITAKVYVTGSVFTTASLLRNDTNVAANLQIYGVPSAMGGTPQIFVNLDTALCAAIYAPLHRITLNGSGDVSGAAVGATFLATGALRFHYDESLAYSAGPLVRYQAASWKEIVSN